MKNCLVNLKAVFLLLVIVSFLMPQKVFSLDGCNDEAIEAKKRVNEESTLEEDFVIEKNEKTEENQICGEDKISSKNNKTLTIKQKVVLTVLSLAVIGSFYLGYLRGYGNGFSEGVTKGVAYTYDFIQLVRKEETGEMLLGSSLHKITNLRRKHGLSK